MALLLALVSAEFFVRFQYNKTTSFSPPEAGWTIFDSELGWVPGPYMSGHERDALVTINSEGARGEEFVGPPEVLAVGDSFTLGALVNDDESWPAFLDKLSDLRVANFGVCAYGVDQMFLRMQRLLKSYDPEVVIMGLIEDNFYRSALDRWVTGQKRPKFKINQMGKWEAPEKILEANSYRKKQTFYDWETILTDWSRVWLLGPYDGVSALNKTPRFYKKGVQISIQLIKRLQKQLSREGIEFHVVLLAGQFEHWGIKSKLESQGLSLIDCSDIYHDKKHVIQGDGHPSVQGHKSYAQCIISIESEGLKSM